jgi:hypothetical protein
VVSSAAVVGSSAVAGSAGVVCQRSRGGQLRGGAERRRRKLTAVLGSAGILGGIANVRCLGCVGCIGCVDCVGCVGCIGAPVCAARSGDRPSRLTAAARVALYPRASWRATGTTSSWWTAARPRASPEPEREEKKRGFFRRLRENMRKTREALAAEVQATLFEGDLDEETWERLEEALIYADVGARTTAQVVEQLEREAEEGGLVGGEQLTARLAELLASSPAPATTTIDIRPTRR